MSGAQGKINEYWDLRGASYDAQAGHGIHDPREHRAWLDALAGVLPPAPSDVLDVGTGTGFLALLIAELGHRVTGVDLAEGMLSVARQKIEALPPAAPPPHFSIGDAGDPPLPAGSFDAVVSRHVLWTLGDPAGAFAAWRRLLRPGGRVVAIDALWQLPTAAPAPGGTTEQTVAPTAAADAWREAWGRLYSPDVQAQLPLFNAKTLDPVVAAATAAGFTDVRVLPLEGVETLEKELYPERKSQPRYVVLAL